MFGGSPSFSRSVPRVLICKLGLDTFVNQFSLTPSNKGAILPASDGHAEVSFDRKGDVRVYLWGCDARLANDGVDNGQLKETITVKNDGNRVC